MIHRKNRCRMVYDEPFLPFLWMLDIMKQNSYEEQAKSGAIRRNGVGSRFGSGWDSPTERPAGIAGIAEKIWKEKMLGKFF